MRHTSPDHRFGCAARVARPNQLKVYRRLGYRVVIQPAMRDLVRWVIFRPRMKTSAIYRLAANLDVAIAEANRWIALDAKCAGLR